MEKINELIDKIASITVKSIPNYYNWEKVEFSIKILISYSENNTKFIQGVDQKGTLGRCENDKGEKIYSGDIAWLLRERMYDLAKEKGAWYSMIMEITSNGSFTVNFDYDTKPKFSIPIEDIDFIKDFQKFPRLQEFIPDWLNKILVK